jgi:cell division protein ZapA (FtsZ GTPase activity inhibitor)
MAADERRRTADRSVHSVPVSIGGRQYKLRGNDPAALERLASRVDGTLRELAGDARPPDDFKLAVLSALNIASEDDDARVAWIEQAAALGRRARALESRLASIRERLADGGI